MKSGDVVGSVGGWGSRGPNSYPPHLHLEVWESRNVLDKNGNLVIDKNTGLPQKQYIPIDPRTVDLSRYQ